MRIISYLIAILTTLAALSTPTVADKRAEDAAAIKSTIVGFLHASDKDDLETASGYLDKTAPRVQLLLLQEDSNLHKTPRLFGGPTRHETRVISVQSTVHRDDATAAVTFTTSGLKKALVTTVRLHRRAGKWEIVVPEHLPKLADENLISLLAFCYTHPMSTIAGRQAARTIECKTQLQFVAISVLQYLQDNDALPTDLSHFDTDLKPYMKSGVTMTCLEVPTLQYQINPHLAGKSAAELRAAPNVVMLYEGTKDGMLFPHDFHGLVAFTDGRVKLISQSNAANLIWNPSGIGPKQSQLRSQGDRSQVALARSTVM